MKSKAATVELYLASLPDDRRAVVSTVRRFILDNLDKDLQECMQYGVIGYCVPHSVWPHGHHTRPELPLMYMGLSSQKNDMVVYMLCLLHNKPMREWFDTAWKATGKKLYMDVEGMGCCLRYKRVEDLSLDVIGDLMRRMPVKKYLEDHVEMLARLGKGPDGEPLKSGAKKPARKSPARVKPSTTSTTRKKRASSRAR